MDKYRMLSKKGEGTFSEVLKCQNTKDGTYWACKRMKQHYKSAEQVKEIREIQALRYLCNHPHVLQLHEVIFERRSGTLNLIFELMDMNLYELMKTQRSYFSSDKVANLMYQLLKAIEHMHKNGYFHRDIKPENILIKDDMLKLADFGSCRRINTKHPYTEYISTRWYRSPEALLTDGYYSYPMDVWSAGCVMFETITLRPLFPGANELDQIDKIHEILGTPDPALLEKFKQKSRNVRFNFKLKKGIGINRFLANATADTIELINLLCTYDPDQRISAHRALKHRYFSQVAREYAINLNSNNNNNNKENNELILIQQQSTQQQKLPVSTLLAAATTTSAATTTTTNTNSNSSNNNCSSSGSSAALAILQNMNNIDGASSGSNGSAMKTRKKSMKMLASDLHHHHSTTNNNYYSNNGYHNNQLTESPRQMTLLGNQQQQQHLLSSGGGDYQNADLNSLGTFDVYKSSKRKKKYAYSNNNSGTTNSGAKMQLGNFQPKPNISHSLSVLSNYSDYTSNATANNQSSQSNAAAANPTHSSRLSYHKSLSHQPAPAQPARNHPLHQQQFLQLPKLSSNSFSTSLMAANSSAAPSPANYSTAAAAAATYSTQHQHHQHQQHQTFQNMFNRLNDPLGLPNLFSQYAIATQQMNPLASNNNSNNKFTTTLSSSNNNLTTMSQNAAKKY